MLQPEIFDDTIDLIIEKAAEGDGKSFELIVEKYQNMVYNICYRYFNNEEDAKDTAQEAFIKIYRNLHKFNYKCKFSTWVYRVVVNLCIDRCRKNKRSLIEFPISSENRKNYDDAENPENAVIKNDFYKEIEYAISKLNEEQRIIVILRMIENLSYHEISMILNVSMGTVKSRISRARQQLKLLLKNENT